MKVLEIGTSELVLIDEVLKEYQESVEEHLDMLEEEDVLEAQYDIAHIKTTRTLLKRQRLQELCERCLSYFWDRLSIEGLDNPDVEWLAEDMGLNVEEFIELFHEAGFKEEE